MTAAGLAFLILAGAAAAAGTPIRLVEAAPALPFSWTQAQALAHYQEARREFWSAVTAVGGIPAEQRTFANTVRALEDARARLEERVAPAGFLSLVSPDPKVRRALTGHLVPVLAREADAYRAIQEYEARGEPLSAPDRLLFNELKHDFRLDGKGLSPAGVDRVQKLLVRLRQLENWFGQNIWDDRASVTAASGELAGLPAELVDGLRRFADGSAAIPVNVLAAYQEVMARARSPELRRRVALAYYRRGAAFNGRNLDEALALRAEHARLLGSPSYAHLAMEERSVKNPRTVARFLYRLRSALAGAIRREDSALLALKKQEEPGAFRLESWDIAYYTRRLLESQGFDETQARAYFPAQGAIDAVLGRLEFLLGVRFVEQTAASWHPSVRIWAVHDADERRLASFYLDAYRREGKTGGRFVQALVRGRELPDGAYREPVFAVVTNFEEPTKGLSHEELVGLLHELGHLLDDVLTRARYARFSGGSFGSGLDRAELPSQMLEQFAWSPAFLASISGRGGDPARPIPAPLLDSMLAHGRVGRARTILAWAARAAIDLALHALRPPRDAARLIDRVFTRFGLPPPPAGHMYQASFSHLMGPYAAGYYTYLLTLNHALDLYSRFERQGPDDSSAGADYRRLILVPGGETELDAAIRAFLGREPDSKALEHLVETLAL